MGFLDVYKQLLVKDVFRVREVYRYTNNNKQVASNMVQFLLKKNFINRIGHGLYYTIPLEISKKEREPNPYILSSKLSKKCFLSYYTALEIHGFAQSVSNTIYISVSLQKASFTFKSYKYLFIKNTKSFGVINKKMNDTVVYYTDVERTFIDCLNTLKYCISLEVFLKSFDNVKINFHTIEKYLNIVNKKVLYQKAGYVLTLMKTDLGVPEELLKRLKKKVSKRTYYLESKMKGANKKNSDWNLMVPRNIEELIKVA